MEPFRGTEAVNAGRVTRYQLANHFDQLYRDVYVAKDQKVSAVEKARAAWLYAEGRGVVSGVSASALHGDRWIDGAEPAEIVQASRFKTAGLLLHSDTLFDGETCVVDGMQVTTPARTAFDLGRRRGLTLAVIRIDALLQATYVTLDEIAALAERHPGRRGVVQFRRAVALADPGAESPQETRTRLVLNHAGLWPDTQVTVYGEHGKYIRRLDMAWPRWKVGVEYDGHQHWENPAQRTLDIETWALLEALGWRLIRVGDELLRHHKPTIVSRTEAALVANGWRPT
jgi:hypothetical protein